MKALWACGLMIAATQVWAAGAANSDVFTGDAKAGKTKAAACGACHGADGNSSNPDWPSLAGQSEIYTVRQLQEFKDGTRKNALMAPQAAGLSEQDMHDIAAHFAAQARKPGVADPNSVEIAETIYRAGNPATGVTACAACHGPAGKGNGAAGYPGIASQHAKYTEARLKAFRAHNQADAATRKKDSPHKTMMTDVAKNLTDAEIAALASYIAGLHD